MARTDRLHIGTNTKMYMNISQTVDFLTKLHSLTKDISRKKINLFVLPSYTALDAARKSVPKESISIGAQNMCWEEQGQFTGEISPLMLKEVGVQIVQIGHSERRHIFNETDIQENKKVLCAVDHGFAPLLCIGETREQREKKIADEILRIQLKMGLNQVTPEQSKKVLIAYEPVWAIGVGGTPASKEYADEKHKVIKQTLIELFGETIGKDIPVLYGGSVNNQNALKLISMPHIDGLFIGRSAWNAENFNKIIRHVLPVFLEKHKT